MRRSLTVVLSLWALQWWNISYKTLLICQRKEIQQREGKKIDMLVENPIFPLYFPNFLILNLYNSFKSACTFSLFRLLETYKSIKMKDTTCLKKRENVTVLKMLLWVEYFYFDKLIFCLLFLKRPSVHFYTDKCITPSSHFNFNQKIGSYLSNKLQ